MFTDIMPENWIWTTNKFWDIANLGGTSHDIYIHRTRYNEKWYGEQLIVRPILQKTDPNSDTYIQLYAESDPFTDANGNSRIGGQRSFSLLRCGEAMTIDLEDYMSLTADCESWFESPLSELYVTTNDIPVFWTTAFMDSKTFGTGSSGSSITIYWTEEEVTFYMMRKRKSGVWVAESLTLTATFAEVDGTPAIEPVDDLCMDVS
jgi:hypothetical protein